ncbi:deoxyribodipyrimidine photo-lyase [Shewanella sp. OPT22]|nr:deoxyribodipyrimidine photo-lyase [Shewanella sp. OPT22]
MDSNNVVVVWFRQDLRIRENECVASAFRFAAEKQCRLIALYLSSPEQWQSHDVAPIQIDFIERNLNHLAVELAQLGVPLKHFQMPTFQDQIDYLTEYCQKNKVIQIFAGKEPEWNEKQRDAQLISHSLPIEFTDEHCILAPGTVLNQQGQMFKVFTPFKKKWREVVSQQHLQKAELVELNQKEIVPEKIQIDATKVKSSDWPAGEKAALSLLKRFCESQLTSYKEQRDFPSLKGTSQLSPYLAMGVLSPKQCLYAILHYFPQALVEATTPAETWLSELIWREFYRHLIVAFPKLCKNQNFKSNADAIQWRNDQAEFKAWCEGKTGYPVVDAAMRQLNQTGWMHNRMRMVTASFLSKHLLIDWRWGERYFKQNLIDGDLAANNGGWQWSAGTGCDAQPYFRIFNPIEQSKKFDNEGAFIYHFVPELSSVSAKALHQANLIVQEPENHAISNNYCIAIVEHKLARSRALEAMKVISQK